MINWEELYYLVCEKISENGHEHHIIPQHTGLEDNTTVKLSFRDHVLAHYIRYKWLHEKGDRMAVQILIRKKIPKFDDEKDVIYKKKSKIKSKINSIHPQIIVVSTPIVIENIIVRKYVKSKKRTIKQKESIKKYNQNINKFPGLDKKLKESLRSKTI